MGTAIQYLNLAYFPPPGTVYTCEQSFFSKVCRSGLLTKEHTVSGSAPLVSAVRTLYERHYFGKFRSIALPRANLLHDSFPLVHSINEPILGASRWVLELEFPEILFVGWGDRRQRRRLGLRIVARILQSNNCGKILVWSRSAYRALLSQFDVSHKTEIVYPAMPLPLETRKAKCLRNDDTVSFLFVGGDFYRKGGIPVLQAFDELRKSSDARLTVVSSSIPSFLFRRFASSHVRFLKKIRREDLFSRIYPQTDVLVLPSKCETGGMVYLEAMSFGIPIIASKPECRPCYGVRLCANSLPEMFLEGVNALTIRLRTRCSADSEGLFRIHGNVEQAELLAKMKLLADDSKLRKQIGARGKREIEIGRFSIKRRNKLLSRVYEECLS